MVVIVVFFRTIRHLTHFTCTCRILLLEYMRRDVLSKKSYHITYHYQAVYRCTCVSMATMYSSIFCLLYESSFFHRNYFPLSHRYGFRNRFSAETLTSIQANFLTLCKEQKRQERYVVQDKIVSIIRIGNQTFKITIYTSVRRAENQLTNKSKQFSTGAHT